MSVSSTRAPQDPSFYQLLERSRTLAPAPQLSQRVEANRVLSARERRFANGADRPTLSGDVGRPDDEGLSSSFLGGLWEAFGPPAETQTPAQPSRLAEQQQPNATVAVFDDFNRADQPNVSTHGELVEGVLQESGLKDEDIQRFQINSGPAVGALKEALGNGDPRALEQYVEARYTSQLDNTTAGLQEILQDPNSRVKTVNQSQSVCQGRIADDVWKEAKGDPAFRADLAQSMGLDASVGDKELAQALADGVDQSASGSEAIARSKNEYDQTSKKAQDAGITHVVTAGNLGGFDREMQSLGVKTDDEFYDSALGNDHTVVVGATDGNGSQAALTSPSAGADLAADGTDRSTVTQDGVLLEHVDGTSVAAPQVSATAAQMIAADPGLSAAELKGTLIKTADPVAGNPQDIGAGQLDPAEALAAAA